jgi:hypothetical protein
MGKAKEIEIKPISRADADRTIKRYHYSGKVVQNSQLHFGVFINGVCGGALQFGPSLDKRKIMILVEGTGWNEFIELNRMAFADWLPRNSESRAIAVVMRILRQKYSQLKWVVSFADAAQCGDGTIYRASGFILTGIKANNQMWKAPTPEGEIFSRMTLTNGVTGDEQKRAMEIVSRINESKGLKQKNRSGGSTMRPYVEAGFKPISGFQLRYLYFLKPEFRQNLTVPIVDFQEIVNRGAKMYKGVSGA